MLRTWRGKTEPQAAPTSRIVEGDGKPLDRIRGQGGIGIDGEDELGLDQRQGERLRPGLGAGVAGRAATVAPAAAATSAVASVEQSSTTRMRAGANVCSRSERTVAATVSTSLYAGTIAVSDAGVTVVAGTSTSTKNARGGEK